MEELERIFKNIDREGYGLPSHKEVLRRTLINHDFFKEKEPTWDLKSLFSSLSFSAIIIVVVIILSPQTIGTDKENLFDRLSNNSNVSVAQGGDMKVIEIEQAGMKTTLYFDNSKKLINSITNK